MNFIVNKYNKKYFFIKLSWIALFFTCIHFIAHSNSIELKVISATNQDTTKSCDTLYFKSGNFILVQYFEIIGDQIKFIKCDQKKEDGYTIISLNQIFLTDPVLDTNASSLQPKLKKSPFLTQYNYASLYLELFGAAPILSINAEYVFKINNDIGISSRIGFGGGSPKFKLNSDIGPSSGGSDVNHQSNFRLEFPIAASFFYGRSFAMEIGYGVTVVRGSSGSGINSQGVNQHAFIGFRVQKLSNRFLFRCGYTPIWRTVGELEHLFGISLGYRFQLFKKGIQEKTINKR